MSDATAITLSGAFVMGLASSGHCFAMCGALAGALGMRARAAAGPAPSALLYQVGRLGGYAIAGAVCGALGATLQAVLDMTSLIVTLRVMAGLVLVLAGVRLFCRWNAFAGLERLGATLWLRLQPLIHRSARIEGARRALVLGLLWGWLPCGLVYSMLLFSALTARAFDGAAVMLAFGLGTLPAMLTSTWLAAEVQQWLARRSLRMVSAALLIGCGIWLAVASLPGTHAHVHAM
jgi:sulfite exporter TauE/SafE